MQSKKSWKLAWCLGLLCAASLTLVSSVPAAAADDPEQPVTLRHTEKAATASYWTLEKRTSAKPMELLEAVGFPVSPASFQPPGPPGSVTGTLSGDQSALLGEMSEPETSVDPDGVYGELEPKIFGGTTWYSYPGPHTRYFPKFGNNFYPHRTLGKLFFSDGISNYVCSGAAVVCPGDQDLVMTAGHCCSDGAGSFYTGFLFVPACVGSGCATAPYGVWDWESVTVLTAWHTSGDSARDVCWLKVQPNASSQQLHQVVGSLGMAWNQTQPVHYHQTGWPAAAPFNGSRLVFEVGSTMDLDGTYTPNTLGVGSGLTGGSSGGAWIKDYKQGATAVDQYWNGLNSYKYIVPARPDEMYGPYIDTTIRNTTTGISVNCP